VAITLKELDLAILAVVHAQDIHRVDQIAAALTLIEETAGEFDPLLKKVITTTAFHPSHGLPGPLTRSVDEVQQSVDALAWYGYVQKTPVYSEFGPRGKPRQKIRIADEIALTDEGVRVAAAHVEGRRLVLRTRAQERDTVFIACAFGRPEVDLLFDREIAPACAALGLRAVKVDEIEPPTTITEEVLAGIRRARIVVADLTFARPSVYFEVGVAHGMGVHVVLTCRSDHNRGTSDAQRVHFDLEQFKISYWSNQGGVFQWDSGQRPVDRMLLLNSEFMSK
jgi:hypothetical protein